MLIYFIAYTPIALIAFGAQKYRVYPVFWYSVFLFIIIFVGLRHQVGMDWGNYVRMLDRVNFGTWRDALYSFEPGYMILLYISGQLGWGIYFANLVGTIIFSIGLFRYVRRTPYPWIALAVAFPYLIVVVAISGARQAIAVGILFWLIGAWNNSSLLFKVTIIALAATFHNSAVVFMLFAVIDWRNNFFIKSVLLSILLAVAAFFSMRADTFAAYRDIYLSGDDGVAVVEASGAIFHILLNAGPAAFALLQSRHVKGILIPDRLHLYLSYCAIFMLPFMLVSSVGASRLSIYFFPVSLMIISSLPLAWKRFARGLRFLVTILFGLVLFVWLGFANNAGPWLNYRNALFISESELVFCCR